MENKQNQPTPGANSSQPTGTNKSASSASPADRSKTPASASAADTASSLSPDAAAVSSPNAAAGTSTDKQSSQSQSKPAGQPDSQTPQQKSGSGQQTWMNVSSWLDGTNQIPQSVKDLGTKATDQFNKLTPTQKVIGGALLVSGLSWLALRSKSSKPASAAKGSKKYGSSTDYRSGSRTYGSYGSYNSEPTPDQQFQGPYGNSASRGISDDYPTKSSTEYRDSGASTSGFGEDDYSTDL